MVFCYNISKMRNTEDETLFGPGMRVRIRDAEWSIKHVSLVKTGGQALYVRGITYPVQGRDQIFWTEAETWETQEKKEMY